MFSHNSYRKIDNLETIKKNSWAQNWTTGKVNFSFTNFLILRTRLLLNNFAKRLLSALPKPTLFDRNLEKMILNFLILAP